MYSDHYSFRCIFPILIMYGMLPYVYTSYFAYIWKMSRENYVTARWRRVREGRCEGSPTRIMGLLLAS